jgi:hypothetical protein
LFSNHAAKESDIEFSGGGGSRPDLDFNTGSAKPRKTLAADLRVGVFDGRHDFANSGLNERVATRPGAAVVRARLERDVGGCALGWVALGECVS